MKELLLYVAKNLVDHPDAVSVTQTEGEDGTLLELRVFLHLGSGGMKKSRCTV